MTARIDSFEGDYAFLSNFYEHNGWAVEHHFQAAKTCKGRGENWLGKLLMELRDVLVEAGV